jgi:hypothetical protein
MFASPALNVIVLAMTFALFPRSLALLKLATVLFLILVFVPAAAPREGAPEPLVNCIIDVPAPETWGGLDGGGTLLGKEFLDRLPPCVSADDFSRSAGRLCRRTHPATGAHRTG